MDDARERSRRGVPGLQDAGERRLRAGVEGHARAGDGPGRAAGGRTLHRAAPAGGGWFSTVATVDMAAAGGAWDVRDVYASQLGAFWGGAWHRDQYAFSLSFYPQTGDTGSGSFLNVGSC